MNRRKQARQTSVITEAVSLAVAEAIPTAMRSYRKLDLDQPLTLELRPIVELRDNAVRHGLKRMLDASYFSICCFESLCKAADVYPPANLDKLLRPLHCMHWSEMEPEFRNQIQQQIIACFVPVEVQTQDTHSEGIEE